MKLRVFIGHVGAAFLSMIRFVRCLIGGGHAWGPWKLKPRTLPALGVVIDDARRVCIRCSHSQTDVLNPRGVNSPSLRLSPPKPFTPVASVFDAGDGFQPIEQPQ